MPIRTKKSIPYLLLKLEDWERPMQRRAHTNTHEGAFKYMHASYRTAGSGAGPTHVATRYPSDLAI